MDVVCRRMEDSEVARTGNPRIMIDVVSCHCIVQNRRSSECTEVRGRSGCLVGRDGRPADDSKRSISTQSDGCFNLIMQ